MDFWIPVVAGLIVNPAADPQWQVGPAPSDFPELQAATVVNEVGDRIYVWPNHRDDRYQIFAEVHLAAPRSFGEAMPVYSIDDGPVVDVEDIRKAGEARSALTAHTRAGVSFWLVWTSPKELIGKDDPFHAWLTGKVLELRYESAAGTAASTAFPLAGAAEAIPEATGVPAEP